MYLDSESGGLLKVGTGRGGTVAGHVYARRSSEWTAPKQRRFLAAASGRLLAFDGDIRTVNGLTIEFTTGGRLPMNRLVAVGIR